MKPPEEIRREFVGQWLAKADDDLAVARHLAAASVRFPAAIAFHAQQAAEKYLKAYLTALQVDFPKTHSIETLLKLAAHRRPALADSLGEAILLTDYAVEARYRADLPELTDEQAAYAVELAALVRAEVTVMLDAFEL